MPQFTQEVEKLQNVAQFIAEKLEGMILQGELAPGTRLIQTEVAADFGVSRLPVRDAFALLIQKDLVVALPRRGVMVREIDLEQLRNLFELRELLECHAVKRSLPRLTPEDLDQAEKLVARQERTSERDMVALLDIDESFHRLLWSRCGNDELDAHIGDVWRRIKVIRAQARQVSGWKKRSLDSHHRILSSLRAGDHKEAASQIRTGIQRSRDELIASLSAH
jgi:DNA-binding GntR family transcriptional regulator